MAASSSSIRGFKFRRNLRGTEHPGELNVIIANSATLTLGDAVRVNTAGYLVRAGAGVPALGILDGIVDQSDINVFSPRATGTAGSTLTPDDTIATSSTNTSDGTRNLKGKVIVDPSGSNLYFNDANGDFSQTNLFQFFDVVANSGQIDQSTASDTSGQFQLVEIDPDGDADASKGLFRLVENQLATNVNSYNSTAINSA